MDLTLLGIEDGRRDEVLIPLEKLGSGHWDRMRIKRAKLGMVFFHFSDENGEDQKNKDGDAKDHIRNLSDS